MKHFYTVVQSNLNQLESALWDDSVEHRTQTYATYAEAKQAKESILQSILSHHHVSYQTDANNHIETINYTQYCAVGLESLVLTMIEVQIPEESDR